MSAAPDFLRRLLGPAPERCPLPAEQLAIDLTSGLRGAEVGLRSFRGRPLLRRFWEAVTGSGQERLAAIGTDLLTVQRATVALVNRIMAEEARTQVCVNLVLRNLHEVNAGLDAVHDRVGLVTGEVAELRRDLVATARDLAAQIHALDQRLDREGYARRLGTLYLADGLHPGAGPLFAAALYLAYIDRLFDGTPEEPGEQLAAQALVTSRFGGVESIPTLLLTTAEGVRPETCEVMVYLCTTGNGPVLAALRSLLERRAAGLSVDHAVAEESLTLARHWHDSEKWLNRGLRRPPEFINKIAHELARTIREG